jgi:hypothetical protein
MIRSAGTSVIVQSLSAFRRGCALPVSGCLMWR